MPMARRGRMSFRGKAAVTGTALGELMVSDVELSMWGGVQPNTGEIIDRHHPLCGQALENRVLVIPGGRGSCSGSGVTLELLLNGKGPKAILFERQEDIITLGVIIAEEIFDKSIPIIVLSPQDFQTILALSGETVYINGESVSVGGTDSTLMDLISSSSSSSILTQQDFHGVRLSDLDQAILAGERGEASRVALRIVLRIAVLMGASELMTVSQVHVDGCFYMGPGSLAFAKRLRDWGGYVQVFTSLNAISVDQRRWRALGVDPEMGKAASELADAYVAMGASPTFTCAPYQLDSAPTRGDQVAWGESNAVIYANSVLGARTMKYPDFLDIAIALTGRAPKGGPHVTANRMASLCIRFSWPVSDVDDSFYPILGYCVGTLAISRIPVITGLAALTPSKDDLRGFAAAFATVSSAPMFHIVGVTPEASSLDAITVDANKLSTVDLEWQVLDSCWNRFNSSNLPAKIDLVALGNPHFSFAEIRELVRLCLNRTKSTDVAVIVTCSRTVYGLAHQAGFIDELEQFGIQFINDTCWCMIDEPIIEHAASTILTNSGKYAHYGPGLTKRNFCYGSLEMCVQASCTGIYSGQKPRWLDNPTVIK